MKLIFNFNHFQTIIKEESQRMMADVIRVTAPQPQPRTYRYNIPTEKMNIEIKIIQSFQAQL